MFYRVMMKITSGVSQKVFTDNKEALTVLIDAGPHLRGNSNGKVHMSVDMLMDKDEVD